MSVKMMGWVFDLELPTKEKFVLLAYADHADHEGRGIYPAIQTIAAKTGYNPRTVQRATRRLEELELLIPDGQGPKGTNKWRINKQWVGVTDSHPDRQSPRTTVTGGVTDSTKRGDCAPPEPSLNRPLTINGGGETPPTLFRLYEENIGAITPLIADQLRADLEDYPESWFPRAIEIAVENNKRSWSYIRAILRRWESDGFDTPFPGAKKNGSAKNNEPAGFAGLRRAAEKWSQSNERE